MKIVVREGYLEKYDKSKVRGNFIALHILFDVVFDIAADIYVETERYVAGEYSPTGDLHLSLRFYGDIENVARKYFRRSVSWNNARTTGWINKMTAEKEEEE